MDGGWRFWVGRKDRAKAPKKLATGESCQVKAIGTLSLSNASLTGLEGRTAGGVGVEGGFSASDIVWRL